jgi:hypothetical protein
MSWTNQQKLFSLEAYFETKESFVSFSSTLQTHSHIVIRFSLSASASFALFGSSMGICATN